MTLSSKYVVVKELSLTVETSTSLCVSIRILTQCQKLCQQFFQKKFKKFQLFFQDFSIVSGVLPCVRKNSPILVKIIEKYFLKKLKFSLKSSKRQSDLLCYGQCILNKWGCLSCWVRERSDRRRNIFLSCWATSETSVSKHLLRFFDTA